MSETRIVGDVLDALNTCEGCYAWRNNTGTAWLNGRHVKFSEKGAADILCVYRGRFVAIECKTATGRQSPAQCKWQTKIEAAGGLYAVARCVTDALSAIGIGPSHPRRPRRTRVIPR